MINLSGLTGTVSLPDLVQQEATERELHFRLGADGPFVFRAWQKSPRPEWHGKRFTMLASNGGVVKIDGVESSYELLPPSACDFDAESVARIHAMQRGASQ